MKKFIDPLLILIIISFTVLPLFHKGYFPVHDDEQVGRLIELDTALKDLQIPPRWTPNLGFGYGYPLFNFYPPFIYYIGEIFHLLGFSFINSIKIIYFLGFFFSAYFMYLFAKSYFGRSGGFLAAAFYTYAPYHALDAYVRGSLSEFFAFVFFPLIFYSFYKKNLILSSLSLACLILTHNLTALIFVPFLLIYIFYLYGSHLTKPILSLFLAFGLSAYFTLPSLFEKKYTLVDKILTEELADFRLHFVGIKQLINSPWGFGGSIPGPFDGLSFEIGKLHLFIIFIAILIIIKSLLSHKDNLPHVVQFVIFLAISIFMTLTISRPVWEILTPLWYLQFPWRFLGLVSFLAALIIGSLSKIFPRKIVLFIIFITIIFYKNLFAPSNYLDINDSYYNSKEGLQWRVSRMSYEYVPKEVKTTKTLSGTTALAITEKDLPYQKVTFINGSGKILSQKIKSQSYVLSLNITSQADIRLSSYNFPGWGAALDGQKVPIDSENDLHLITINNIPPGPHTLSVKFENTPIRTLANFISFIAIIIIIILFIKKLFKTLVTYPIIESVGIVVFNKDQVLLVRHGIASNYNEGILGIPSGKIEKGESRVRAAKRELEEESGLKAKLKDLIPLPKAFQAKIEQKDGIKIFKWHVFLCKKYSGELVTTDETEPFWVALKEINKFKLLPNVKKAIVIAQKLFDFPPPL